METEVILDLWGKTGFVSFYCLMEEAKVNIVK
jgi:hypothetical protein